MKGSISLDALAALVIALMVFAWIQGYAKATLENSNNFGANMGVKAAAISVGSQMAAFYAWKPGQNDFITVSERIMLLNLTTFTNSSKSAGSNYANVWFIYRGNLYNSTYPVPTELYQETGAAAGPQSQRVRR